MDLKVIVMVGNVGSGKSTKIKQFLEEIKQRNALLSVKRDREK